MFSNPKDKMKTFIHLRSVIKWRMATHSTSTSNSMLLAPLLLELLVRFLPPLRSSCSSRRIHPRSVSWITWPPIPSHLGQGLRVAKPLGSKGVEWAHPRLRCRPCHRCRLPRQVSKWEWGTAKGSSRAGKGKEREGGNARWTPCDRGNESVRLRYRKHDV